jgi:NADH-quinone oxidoreductase subunit N
MTVLAALPPLQPPSAHDLIGLLPELIIAGAFVALLMADLFTPATRRSWLAALSAIAMGAALVVSVLQWNDAGHARTLYSGAFAYDRFGLFFNVVLLASGIVTVLISPAYLNKRGLHHGEYYALILASIAGMMLLAGATSLMVIFLAIELLSIALYILSGFARNEERSQEAGLKYLLLGGFASGFLLYGMALIYGTTGHTQLEQIGAALQLSSGTDPLFLVGVVMMFVGFAFKISAAPFHTWTPDVYQGAPTSVTTFMSVATKVAAFAVLIRVFTFTLAPTSYDRWSGIVSFVAIISMVVGNVAALSQTSVKRMLAYSGIAQAGYILIGVALHTADGTIASLYYLAAYAATNLGAFAVITIMAGRDEDIDSYDSLRGLWFRRPYVAMAMGWFLLSLGGFPFTAGFIGKLLVFRAAVEAHVLLLVMWGVVTSAISVAYYLRVALLMVSRPKDEETAYRWSRTTLGGAVALVATAGGTLLLGVFVFLVYSAASAAQQGIIPQSGPPG